MQSARDPAILVWEVATGKLVAEVRTDTASPDLGSQLTPACVSMCPTVGGP
jgi:hypothetical protein